MTLKAEAEWFDSMETLIDTEGIADVLGIIASVCSHKAQHIISSYGDCMEVEKWDAVGNALVRIAEECEL